MIHHNLPKIVLMMENNHLLKMIRLKLLVLGLQSVGLFHQLADKYNVHKKGNNIQIEIYLMRFFLNQTFIHYFLYC